MLICNLRSHWLGVQTALLILQATGDMGPLGPTFFPSLPNSEDHPRSPKRLPFGRAEKDTKIPFEIFGLEKIIRGVFGRPALAVTNGLASNLAIRSSLCALGRVLVDLIPDVSR